MTKTKLDSTEEPTNNNSYEYTIRELWMCTCINQGSLPCLGIYIN